MMIPSNIINLNFQFEYQRWWWKRGIQNWIFPIEFTVFFSLIHRLIAYRFVLKPEILLFSVRFIFFIILVGPIFCFVNCFWLFFLCVDNFSFVLFEKKFNLQVCIVIHTYWFHFIKWNWKLIFGILNDANQYLHLIINNDDDDKVYDKPSSSSLTFLILS